MIRIRGSWAQIVLIEAESVVRSLILTAGRPAERQARLFIPQKREYAQQCPHQARGSKFPFCIDWYKSVQIGTKRYLSPIPHFQPLDLAYDYFLSERGRRGAHGPNNRSDHLTWTAIIRTQCASLPINKLNCCSAVLGLDSGMQVLCQLPQCGEWPDGDRRR